MRDFRMMKPLAALALLLSAFATPVLAVDPLVLEAQQKRIEVVEKVAPTVVAIFANGGQGGGSGVLISPDGYALTNFHVTSGAGNFMKCGLNDGVLYDAVIVGIDPTGDVALIKLLGREDFPHSPMGNSDEVEVGDWAYAMGNPFLLADDFQPTVTFGIVSGTNRYQYPAGTFLEYTDCIQIDTSINPGNSGGPLFNTQGEIIGINGRGSFEKRGRVNSGAGYAISINQIKHFLGHLKSGRVVDHATLGATVRSDDNGLVVIDSILESSEAYRRGLREGDEIISFGGRPIRSVNQFKNLLGIYPKGWTLPITYRHEGEKKDVFVRLRALHRKSEMTPGEERPMPQPKEKKPEDGKPGEEKKPGEEQPKPQPMPLPQVHREPPAPEQFKHMFVKKSGYANYYFNQLEQSRLLDHLKQWGSYEHRTGKWTLTGTTQDGKLFEQAMTDKGIGLKYNDNLYYQGLDGSDLVSDPPESGGLLIALYHLKLLLSTHGKQFSEFYYLGTEPLAGNGEMVDVLIGVLTGATSRFYFSQQSGELIGFDMQLAEDVDECEIRFLEFGEFQGLKFPTKLQVKRGGNEYATITLKNVQLPEPTPMEEKQPEEPKADEPKAEPPKTEEPKAETPE